MKSFLLNNGNFFAQWNRFCEIPATPSAALSYPPYFIIPSVDWLFSNRVLRTRLQPQRLKHRRAFAFSAWPKTQATRYAGGR